MLAKCTLIVFGTLFIVNDGYAQESRNLDGFGNNEVDPEIGTTGSLLSQMTTIGYADGINLPGGENRLNPRAISNYLFAQKDMINDSKSLSDYNWVFGQFIDHDVSLVDNADPSNSKELLAIVPPQDDEFFNPDQLIMMMRSKVAEGTGTSFNNQEDMLMK